MAAERMDPEDETAATSQIAEIISASSNNQLSDLERFFRDYSFAECRAVDVQDRASGNSPLHAVMLGAGTRNDSSIDKHREQVAMDIEGPARETVKYLLENGAIWNQLNFNDETPGCIAYRLRLHSLYQLMVDAGVRAEMLLNRLEGYEMLEDDDVEEIENDVEGSQETDVAASIPTLGSEDAVDETATETEDVPMLIQAGASKDVPTSAQDVNSAAYLSSTLSMGDGKLLDEQQNGVMMAWESGIMSLSADELLYGSGLRILNIGFGMGIIDSHIQAHKNKPSSHHIVEAHPDVLAAMKRASWHERSGVVIHAGRWQEVLPALVAENETFDAIYFDTFAESYGEFREFFSEQVIGLLNEAGKWSFFNGMGADRQISYDVYQKVVELDLFESGFDVEWRDVELPKIEQEWEGVKRKYWNVGRYRLPVCKFID